MRSQGDGSQSAAMRKREGYEPRNNQRSNWTTVSICRKSVLVYALNGEYISARRGLRPWRVDENVRIGTWESQSVPMKL